MLNRPRDAIARARLHAPDAQAVTFVELFFDLVFVFAVTQITAVTAADLTWSGVGRSLVLFWLIWWAWTQFTWTLNPADTNHTAVRAITLVGTACAFVMAASVSRAYDDGVVWFVVPYVLVRLIGLGLQVRIDRERGSAAEDGEHTGTQSWAATSLIGLVLVVAGACFDPPVREWIWVAAIVADLVATSRAGGGSWNIDAAHFSERHGLIVIIALGESLIVAGSAVAGQVRSELLVLDVAAALAAACLLWWTYFAWCKDALERALERQPPDRIATMCRDVFSLGHFVVVAGIVGFAIALEEIGHHPEAVPHTEVVLALGVGVALFVGATAFGYWRAGGGVLWPRLAILVVTLGALAAVSTMEPFWPLAVVATGLLVIAVVERDGPRPDAPEQLAEIE